MNETIAPLFNLVKEINSAACCGEISAADNPRMDKSKKSKIEPVHIDEAAKLKALFKANTKLSQAEFGAEFEIGSQGMVWQYLNANSPLNIQAACRFAKGLRCNVIDFSPRLSKELDNLELQANLRRQLQDDPSGFGASDEEISRFLSRSSDTHTPSQRAKSESLLISLSDHPDLVSVPRVKFKLSAGVSGFAIESENGNGKPVFFRKDWFETNNYKPDKLFAVRVSGASMEPALWDGDLVVINTADTNPHDGEAFAINYEGEMVIKRMRRDAGEWWASSDNADQRRFAPKRCTEDVVVIGRVIYKQSERI